MNIAKFSYDYDRLRQLLITYRKEAGVSQVQLARALQMPQSYVSKYERGERRLTFVEVMQIVEVLRVDPHDLIDKFLPPSAQAEEH